MWMNYCLAWVLKLACGNEYLEATLGLVKHLEISKELIRECVTVPGCCCCMPLLHNHLMDSCSYVRKNTLLAAKGGAFALPKCTPLTPPKSTTVPPTFALFHPLSTPSSIGSFPPSLLLPSSPSTLYNVHRGCTFITVLMNTEDAKSELVQQNEKIMWLANINVWLCILIYKLNIAHNSLLFEHNWWSIESTISREKQCFTKTKMYEVRHKRF